MNKRRIFIITSFLILFILFELHSESKNLIVQESIQSFEINDGYEIRLEYTFKQHEKSLFSNKHLEFEYELNYNINLYKNELTLPLNNAQRIRGKLRSAGDSNFRINYFNLVKIYENSDFYAYNLFADTNERDDFLNVGVIFFIKRNNHIIFSKDGWGGEDLIKDLEKEKLHYDSEFFENTIYDLKLE